ncbi:hypothetical protein NLX86_15065 [Streptomyces sp. A3M-1-3]|uniref:hypothetical protein n=1 Tax=Streptomyces sp. A3M-1-3 TaxID=2962044 RepID=UPI0020B8BBC1|nr:hypothetical protein [Streptomyces sp. A3M-1-3]MCP3819376.1 hypothetical protein [Streptomyces sp. A3M-1-3]
MAAARRRFVPDFDPDFGDRPLTAARHDIVIGRWQGVRDLLLATGPVWPRRTHRLRLLAHAAAGSSAVESWLAAEPENPDAVVLRAATEVVRIFNVAIATGRGGEVDRDRIDLAVMACLRAADACPDDPMPWASLLTVARLYEGGVQRRELASWWSELRGRDPYNIEGHVQMLRYYSARWHGTHGTMYDFARDAAGAAPPGSPLPVLVQIARVEEYRYIAEGAKGRPVIGGGSNPGQGQGQGQGHGGHGQGQHWNHELAVQEVRRTWDRWIAAREGTPAGQDGPVPPEEVTELNYLTHAACYAGLHGEAAHLFRVLDGRAARVPWSYTGDAAQQFTRWREQVGATT